MFILENKQRWLVEGEFKEAGNDLIVLRAVRVCRVSRDGRVLYELSENEIKKLHVEEPMKQKYLASAENSSNSVD